MDNSFSLDNLDAFLDTSYNEPSQKAVDLSSSLLDKIDWSFDLGSNDEPKPMAHSQPTATPIPQKSHFAPSAVVNDESIFKNTPSKDQDMSLDSTMSFCESESGSFNSTKEHVHSQVEMHKQRVKALETDIINLGLDNTRIEKEYSAVQSQYWALYDRYQVKLIQLQKLRAEINDDEDLQYEQDPEPTPESERNDQYDAIFHIMNKNFSLLYPPGVVASTEKSQTQRPTLLAMIKRSLDLIRTARDHSLLENKSELQELRAKNSDLELQLEHAEKNRQQMSATISNLSERVVNFQNKSSAASTMASTERSSLIAQNNGLLNQNNELIKQLTAMGNSSAMIQANSNSKIQKLNQEIQNLKDENQILKSQTNSVEKEQSESVSSLKTEAETYKCQLVIAQHQIDRLKNLIKKAPTSPRRNLFYGKENFGIKNGSSTPNSLSSSSSLLSSLPSSGSSSSLNTTPTKKSTLTYPVFKPLQNNIQFISQMIHKVDSNFSSLKEVKTLVANSFEKLQKQRILIQKSQNSLSLEKKAFEKEKQSFFAGQGAKSVMTTK